MRPISRWIRPQPRIAFGCGPQQLALSRWAQVRRRLQDVVWRSDLSIREAANCLGIAPSTLERHLAGARPCESRLAFYDRLEAFEIDHEHVHIVLRRGSLTRKRWGWRGRRPKPPVPA